MSRNFNSTNNSKTINRFYYRSKWEVIAYPTQNGMGQAMIKNFNFVERVHYGMIDNLNNSIIPNEDFMVNTQHGQVFDFVADSYSLMRLNWTAAVQKNLVSIEGSAFENLRMVDSYKNPRAKYGEYLGDILRYYNNTYIPSIVGINNITSYEVYVKGFFDYLFKNKSNMAITMTRWNASNNSNILDTGLGFSYSNIPYDADQRKINEVVDHPSFDYFKNLCMNMGFSIAHSRPNILIYDLTSPAGNGIRESYGLYNLNSLFESRFIKTYTIDNNMLYNNINIYYNKYVHKNPQTKVIKIVCGQTVSEYIRLSTVSFTKQPYTDLQQLKIYCELRNLEEGKPFTDQKVNNIYKKAKYFLKKVDKSEAMGYINSEYRDQVWNKNHGAHDLNKKLEGKTKTQTQRAQDGSNRGGSSSY